MVLISRGGGVSFFEKANRAAAAGAAATVIYNNVDGTLSMNLEGYTYTAPAVILSKADAGAVLAASTQDAAGIWGGKVTVTNQPQTVTIYSTLDGGTYGLNSGTSMSAPSVTGSAAVVAQYIKENHLDEKTGLHVRTLAIALLMGTARPLLDDAVGLPYSPRLQGAGLSQVYEAVTAPAYLLVGEQEGNDGKVKMELGDDPHRTGVYSGSFSIHNITDQPLLYSLDSQVFTMAAETIDGQEYMSKKAYELRPQVDFETQAQVVYTYDLNGDGKVDVLDAKRLLQVANGTAKALGEEDASLYDFDADGVITTGDAQRFLAAIRGGATEVDITACAYRVPANGSIQVQATIALSEQDKAYLNGHYPNGGYVDGYLYVHAEDGTDKEMSIPLLAYYGNWSEPSMYDKYVLLEDKYDAAACGYVQNGYENFLAWKLKGSSATNYYMPNPFVDDTQYIPDRNAFSNTSTLAQASISLIRNADHVAFFITNADTGEVYATVDRGSGTGAYYSASSASWSGVATNHTLNWYVTDAEGQKLPEGTRVSVTARAVPEYYWDRENKQVTGELASGAYWTTTFTIDNTAPEATSVAMTADAITGDRSLRVKVRDNRYVAAVLVLTMDGQVLSRSAVNQTELGVESAVDLDISQIYTNHFIVAVCDYASNMAAYEVNFGGSVPIPEAETMLTAALQDDAGLWFVDVDADHLQSVSTKHTAAKEVDLLSAARGGDGTLYVASNEKDSEGHMISSLYTVDEADYAMTKVGTSEAGYSDMSRAPGVHGGIMLASYGPYLLVLDPATGGYQGAWTITSYTNNAYAVGIAYVGTQPHDTYGQVDVCLVLCNDGTIYQTAFAYSSSDQKYVIFPFTALIQIPGMAANTIAGSSLYCAQDGKLFISALTEQGSKLLYVDLTASNAWLFELGTLNTAPVSIYGASAKEAANGTGNFELLQPLGEAMKAKLETTVLPQLDR